uniref:Uncharacterized protein n=1 Tax=Arundo donax TaxID=35708 RepID=A0A0A9E8I3_ARUDO
MFCHILFDFLLCFFMHNQQNLFEADFQTSLDPYTLVRYLVSEYQ